nr:uncharacterized protein LOC127325921 [Lolium perenne]
MPSRRGTAPRGVAIAGTEHFGLSIHPEQAPSRRGLLHQQGSHRPARIPSSTTTSPTNTPPLPQGGSQPMLPPTELHHTTHPPQHLMPQQTPCQAAPKTQLAAATPGPPPRHPLRTRGTPAGGGGAPRTSKPVSHHLRAAPRPPWQPRTPREEESTSAATQQLLARPRPAGHSTHPPPQHSTCDARRGPDRARVGPPAPATPQPPTTAPPRPAVPIHLSPPAAADEAPGPPPRLPLPVRRRPTRAGLSDEGARDPSPPLEMRPAATAARAGGSGGRAVRSGSPAARLGLAPGVAWGATRGASNNYPH